MSHPFFAKPGYYDGLPIEQYHASEGYSSSQLKYLLKTSPYAFRWKEDNEPVKDFGKWGDTNRLLALGGATAALADGQDVFNRTYYVLDTEISGANKNSKVFKDGFRSAVERNPDKTVILHQECEQAMACVEAVHNHWDPWTREQIESFFAAANMVSERSYYLLDEETGLLIKTRPDNMIPKAMVLDWKQTDNCGVWSFQKRMFDMGHHVQASMGLDIINKVDKCAIDVWMLLVVERDPPYDAALYRIGKPSFMDGYKRYRKALVTLSNCLNANAWPGKMAGIDNEINIPAYALNEDVEIPTVTGRRTAHE